MHAIARVNSFDPDLLAAHEADMEQFDAVHAAQPGFAGRVVVDLEAGRQLVVNLWDTADDAMRARSVIAPEVQRVLEPLMSAPTQFIGAGTVRHAELSKPTDARSKQ